MNQETLMQLALDCGAAYAASLDGGKIVLSAAFRAICRSNGCGHYGRCYMCPPDIGEIDALMDEVRRYSKAVVYQTIGTLEDSFDIEGMTAAAVSHASVSQGIQQALKNGDAGRFLHLTCGGCHLCKVCAKQTGEACRHPSQPLPSLEGFGIDVYQTIKDTKLKYINGPDTVTFFGMILFGA